MNKYHNRNRIISPIMTIHDILTLHILSSFLSSLSFFSLLSSLSLSFFFLSFLFFPLSLSPSPLSSLLSSLPFFSPLSSLSSLFSFSLSVFSVFYREGRTLSHHPDVERYCARLSE